MLGLLVRYSVDLAERDRGYKINGTPWVTIFNIRYGTPTFVQGSVKLWF